MDSLDCNTTDLKQGSTGEKVTFLQTWLTNWKYYDGKINGIFGPITEASVKQFQKDTGHTQDGWFGPKTCASFNEKLTSTASTTTSSTTTTTSEQVVTKKVLPDQYSVDLSRNLFRADESNICIDGLYFPCSSIEPTTSFGGGNWKIIELMDGYYPYLGHEQNKAYTVELYLSRYNFLWMKNEFDKMTHRVCEVLSEWMDSGKYIMSIQYTTSKGTWKKVTMTLTEYREA